MNFISNRTQINKLKRVMKRAAIISGKHLMKAYKRKKVNITEKSKKEWVTETDLAVEKIIIKELIKDYPGSNFIAEESGTNISDPKQITWIIDPIDGTNNFITKYPYFCISIAGYISGEIISGCILNPLTNELFLAVKGQGAYLNNKKYKVSDETRFSNLIYGTGFVISAPQSVKKNMKNLQSIVGEIKSFRRTGSAALDLAYASCGRQHGYWQLLARPWDYAAGVILMQEAGGIVTEVNGKKLNLESKSLLASNNSKNHKKMISKLID